MVNRKFNGVSLALLILVLAVSLACAPVEPVAVAGTPEPTPNIAQTVEAAIQATTEAQPEPTASPTSIARPTRTVPPAQSIAATIEAAVEATIVAMAPPTPAATPSPDTPPATKPAPTAVMAPTARPTQTALPAPTATPSPPTLVPTQVIEWQEIRRWTGGGISSTGLFQVRFDQWRLTWVTQPGRQGDEKFLIRLYNANRTLNTTAVDGVNLEPGSINLSGAGDYYLVIIAAQPYTIAAEGMR